jgi:hypothetical protein
MLAAIFVRMLGVFVASFTITTIVVVALALWSSASQTEARQISTVCEGVISPEYAQGWMSIGFDQDQPCVFRSDSAEARKILQVCRGAGPCRVRVEGDFENTATRYELLRLKKVRWLRV